MSENHDLQSLLAQILDDQMPLPTPPAPEPVAAPPAPEPVATITPVPTPAAPETDDLLGGFFADMQGVVAVQEQMEAAHGQPPAEHPTAAQLRSVIAAPAPEVTPSVTPAAAAPADQLFTDQTVKLGGGAMLKMPVFTAEDFAETTDIRNFAMLAVLNTSRWHAKAKDRRAAKDAAEVNEAKDTAFEVKKHLLAGADTALKDIHRIIDDARAAHYDLTLPWSTTSLQDKGKRTGARLLPNSQFEKYIKCMHDFKTKMDAALDVFVPQYPALIEQARQHLGKRFDAGEYPNASSIRGHFDLSFDFQPLPKGEDFRGLPSQQLQALAEKINANTRKMAEHAMQDVWQRMHEAVSHMAERLSSPDKVFHASMLDNIQKAASAAEHLNITGDTRVEQVRQKIVQHLCGHGAKALRENQVLRQKVAAMAASILYEMEQAS